MTKKNCKHYPIINNPIWKVVERDMHHIVRQCSLCGAVDVSYLTSYRLEQFMTDRHRHNLEAQRQRHGKDLEQPWVNGKPNEKFVKAYENEPEKLTSTYSTKELRNLQMPKLAKVKEDHATQS